MSSTSTVTVWYLQYSGKANPRHINVPGDALIDELTDAIGDKLGFSQVERESLTLWKPNKELPIENNAKNVLKERIDAANGRLDAVATEMAPYKSVNELIGDGVKQRNNNTVHVIVLVGAPRPSPEYALEQIRNYIGSEKKLLFYVNQFNVFRVADLGIQENKISFAHNSDIHDPWSTPLSDSGTPKFLKRVIDTFARRRQLPEALKSESQYKMLEAKMGEVFLSTLFETMSEGDEVAVEDKVTVQELFAYCKAIESASQVDLANAKYRSSHYKDSYFTANFVDAVFHDASYERDGYRYNKGVATHPSMLVQEDTLSSEQRIYKPMSDFFVETEDYVPVLIGEVISTASETDRVRMLLQAAVYVRVGNVLCEKDLVEGTVLKDNGSEDSFVLVCFYLNSKFKVERYLVYQRDTGKEEVEILQERKFTMSNQEEAMRLTFELFNYRQHVLPRTMSGFARKGVPKKLIECFRDLHLRSLSSRRRKDQSESQNPSKKSARGSNSGLGTIVEHTQLLKSFNIHTVTSVYHRPHVALARKVGCNDEFVVKIMKRGSSELQLLRLLNSPELRSQPQNHTIPVVDIIDVASTNTCIVVMPKLVQYCPKLITETAPSVLCDYLYQLIEGVAFLHNHNISHLDLKTANIVVDTNARKLYIIDYDCAMRLHDTEEQISEYVGTEDWTAPEVGEGDYSPIRADRWAVGELIQHAFTYCNQLREMGHLDEMARLLRRDPMQRPALQDLLTICRANERHDAFHSKNSTRPTTLFPQPTTVMVA